MLSPLPEKIDPLRAARQAQTLRGSIPSTAMARLAGNLAAPPEHPVWVDWRFGLDEHQRAWIEGTLRGEFSLVCQRCLQPMAWKVEAEVKVCFLPPGVDDNDLEEEAILLDTPSVSLVELAEDELILALPIAPMHPRCPDNDRVMSPSPDNDNPFAVLKTLLKD